MTVSRLPEEWYTAAHRAGYDELMDLLFEAVSEIDNLREESAAYQLEQLSRRISKLEKERE